MASGENAPIPLDLLAAGMRNGRSRLTGPGSGVPAAGTLRVAFLGRTSTEDQQDPTLSIPRQLASCRGALPDGILIVAHFYDVESGRKDLDARGRGRGHERFVIPVPREGGIQDLLDEVGRSDRRFDAVICESIERIARRTYVGTLIEKKLEEVGVALLAADEPIIFGGKKATQVLTRRVKQGVAEWYVLELLEKSWGGTEEHTEQGFNVGKPPYGYLAMKIPHPVPARRAEGASKHRLMPDPRFGPVVTTIFAWRVGEGLGYQAIADRLNLDLDRYPAPEGVDPTRAVGRWTHSSVREILINPKYTGYMVWNRRATKSNGGKVNPPEVWVWSSKPTHEPLVSVDTFTAAHQVGRRRERSRSASTATTRTTTNRTYRLRSYITCDDHGCCRRMFGKECRKLTYYLCRPPAGYVPEGHPQSIWLREEPLMKAATEFFGREVFGRHRQARLAIQLSEADIRAAADHEAALEAVRKTIKDTAARRTRLIGNLELLDNPDAQLLHDLQARTAQLSAEIEEKKAKLSDLENTRPARHCPELLSELPIGAADLEALPQDILRKLFDAFRFEMRYDHEGGLVRCQVTMIPDALPAQRDAAQTVITSPPRADHGGDHSPVCSEPPRGLHTGRARGAAFVQAGPA